MKKFLLKLLVPLLAALAPAMADGAVYRVDIDDVTRVELDIFDTPVTNLHNGLNEIEMGTANSLRVKAVEGVVFTEVTLIDSYYNEETSWLGRVDLVDGRQYVDLHSSFPEDESFRIRTSGATDVRTASCTVTVDDPTRIKLVRKNSDEAIELQPGVATTVKFDPKGENELILTPAGDKPLYSVKLNGEPVAGSGYSYTIPVADGDEVEVQALYPDIDCSVSFVFANQDALDFIKTIDIEGKPVFATSVAGATFTAKLGDGLEISGDTDRYEVMEFTVNGTPVAFFNPFRLLIESDLEIRIAVRRYASFDMTVNVDDPSRVHIYQGYSYNNVEYQLVAGENTVEVLRNTPIVSLVPADGCYIKSVTIGEDVLDAEELQVAPVMIGSIVDGEALTVTTGVIVRDQTAVVYLEGLESAKDYFKLMRADQSELEGLVEGYNTISFYDGDNRFRLVAGAPVPVHVFVNELPFDAEYPESPNYRPALADGDVLKVVFGDAPALHTILFEAHPDAEDSYALVRDRIVPVAGTSGTVSALRNTEFRIIPADGAELAVLLDGDPLKAEDDGSYTFNVTDNHAVYVSHKSSGLESLDVEASGDCRYYNLQGIRVAQPAAGTLYIRVQGGKARTVVAE